MWGRNLSSSVPPGSSDSRLHGRRQRLCALLLHHRLQERRADRAPADTCCSSSSGSAPASRTRPCCCIDAAARLSMFGRIAAGVMHVRSGLGAARSRDVPGAVDGAVEAASGHEGP